MELGRLIAAVDELASEDVAGMPAGLGNALVELQRQIARLQAVAARTAAAFDASGEWRPSKAASAAMWLAASAKLPDAVAHRTVRLGRQMRQMPETDRAWSSGTITEHHVRVLAGLRNNLTIDAFARDEEMLVGFAKEMSYAGFGRACAYWKQLADPDGTENDVDRQRDARAAHLSQTLGGMWVGDQRFDSIDGEIVNNELKRLERQRFDQEWREAKERLGYEPTIYDLASTAEQRRADAWVEMARRSAAMPPGSREARVLISVLVGYETFAGRMCQTAAGRVVTPGSVGRLLPEADIGRIVFDGPSRVIDVGAKRRFFRGATRRAIEIRDRECFHPMCEMTIDGCQADHIEPASAGGLTVQANGRLACGRHNRGRHQRPPADDSS